MANETITRALLVKALILEVGLSRNECAELLDDFIGTMKDCLAKGETIKVQNFGSLSVRHKGAQSTGRRS